MLRHGVAVLEAVHASWVGQRMNLITLQSLVTKSFTLHSHMDCQIPSVYECYSLHTDTVFHQQFACHDCLPSIQSPVNNWLQLRDNLNFTSLVCFVQFTQRVPEKLIYDKMVNYDCSPFIKGGQNW